MTALHALAIRPLLSALPANLRPSNLLVKYRLSMGLALAHEVTALSLSLHAVSFTASEVALREVNQMLGAAVLMLALARLALRRAGSTPFPLLQGVTQALMVLVPLFGGGAALGSLAELGTVQHPLRMDVPDFLMWADHPRLLLAVLLQRLQVAAAAALLVLVPCRLAGGWVAGRSRA
ncbi:hypothetical protein UAJ10_07855 [Nitrospirillum sp. BR 11164]|uniref:hypothetical protein n=1 Tax=Nitrospirillum sp. BR 11164 TaxID=3104324 RepID=UPI002AFECE5C|nr:hypothetical protein [Nitrospirillum sp. BR 11164]MEA1648932.1 hypothetical protein [Nitrospirillum sp. BR 11164]